MDIIRKIKKWLFVNSPVLFIKNCWRFRKQLANFRTFDYKYNLDLFCASLEITREFMLSDKVVSSTAEKTAEDIQYFLVLLRRYDNAIEIVERELGYEFSPLEDPDHAADRKLITRIESIEETSWLEAFNFLRDRMRSWWD